jgi:hypothetical protein
VSFLPCIHRVFIKSSFSMYLHVLSFPLIVLFLLWYWHHLEKAIMLRKYVVRVLISPKGNLLITILRNGHTAQTTDYRLVTLILFLHPNDKCKHNVNSSNSIWSLEITLPNERWHIHKLCLTSSALFKKKRQLLTIFCSTIPSIVFCPPKQHSSFS